jgi:hypothetical protein
MVKHVPPLASAQDVKEAVHVVLVQYAELAVASFIAVWIPLRQAALSVLQVEPELMTA